MKGKFNKGRMPIIKLEGKNVRFAKEVKYLSVVLDEGMNFVAHSKYLRDKLTGFVMSIRRLARDDWGLKRNTLKILYSVVVVPIVTYGAAI